MNPYFGKLALVTGAGDGIGAMLARGFAQWGMRVAVADIRIDAAAAVANQLGNGAFPLVFDVSDRDECFEAAKTLKAEGDLLSLLWVNAGAGVGSGLVEGRPSFIEWAMSVNLLGPVWTLQAFAPLLVDSGLRHVGFTASTASLRQPEAQLSLYHVSKMAAFAAMDGMKAELAAKGVASTILFPGLLNTNIWDGARARPERFGGPRNMDSSISDRWTKAKDPALMWPHIERVVLSGGGYLTCATEPGMREGMEAYHELLKSSIIEI
jgi:NAD(P)-dependent dehydrogenase (short-subunit alcohol dehydrogenase family)